MKNKVPQREELCKNFFSHYEHSVRLRESAALVTAALQAIGVLRAVMANANGHIATPGAFVDVRAVAGALSQVEEDLELARRGFGG